MGDSEVEWMACACSLLRLQCQHRRTIHSCSNVWEVGLMTRPEVKTGDPKRTPTTPPSSGCAESTNTSCDLQLVHLMVRVQECHPVTKLLLGSARMLCNNSCDCRDPPTALPLGCTSGMLAHAPKPEAGSKKHPRALAMPPFRAYGRPKS